jgi:dihydrofolate reductase
MRKVVFSVANSVDNFIADEDGGVDWLLDSADANVFLEELFEPIDAVVMGRKTYEFAVAHGMDAYPGVKNYVLSTTLDPARHDKVTVVNEDTAALVRRLKEEDGGDIFIVGGADIARKCFEAGLIDEFSINIHPRLLGKGAPLFLAMDEQVELELIECRAIEHGCVILIYRVRH